ncbi:hypothetical protein OHA40_17120 [Nocardia sp. NBC_00508]|uniref:hypothetical protein n=1 Tax=Nocardia sp. NBC_00508 TaxID=2975992 RepID=UPI002E8196EB|nr:hypothetical protein [Nocardia sp. NBC_00508]WUD63516.1 hypothetical protein OHA40_17120 [Nocardia sp. NBC_00508]
MHRFFGHFDACEEQQFGGDVGCGESVRSSADVFDAAAGRLDVNADPAVDQRHEIGSAVIDFGGSSWVDVAGAVQVREVLRPSGDQVVARAVADRTAECGTELVPVRYPLKPRSTFGMRSAVPRLIGRVHDRIRYSWDPKE